MLDGVGDVGLRRGRCRPRPARGRGAGRPGRRRGGPAGPPGRRAARRRRRSRAPTGPSPSTARAPPSTIGSAAAMRRLSSSRRARLLVGHHRGDGLGGIAACGHGGLPLDHLPNARRGGADQLGDGGGLGHVLPVFLRHVAAGDGEVQPRRVEGALVVAAPAGLERIGRPARRSRLAGGPTRSSRAVPVQRADRRQDRPVQRAEPLDEEAARSPRG